MIGWLILTLLSAFLIWMLWAPIRLEIDTNEDLFQLRWQGFGAIQWLPKDGLDCIRFDFWLFHKKIFLSRVKTAEKAKPIPKPQKKSNFKISTMWRLFKNLWGSFTVRYCRVTWDTEDFLWNAWAYPLAQAWGNGRVEVNFQGRQEVRLLVENRLGKLAGVLLRTFIFKNRSIS